MVSAAPAKSHGLREETSSEGTLRLLRSTASSDHLPGPFTMRNVTVSICAYSDRISCNELALQLALLCRSRISSRGKLPSKQVFWDRLGQDPRTRRLQVIE